jgi:opacity protein-like surface antigen
MRKHLIGLSLGLIAAAGIAVPAAAQSLDAPATPVSVSFSNASLVKALPSSVSFLADADQARPGTGSAPMHQMGDKQFMAMVQGGLITCCSNTGFLIGAGVSAKPIHDNDKVEVGGDFNFARIFSSNGIYVSINGQYDIHLQNTSRTVPFLGGGIAITHFEGFTNTDLQIFGGADFDTASGKAIRAQVRFILGTETSTLLMVGYAF